MRALEFLIQRAIVAGKFKDLPGKGKPLELDENPFEDPEWRLAYRILANSRFAPSWVESRRKIKTDLNAAREELQGAWQRHNNPDPEDADWRASQPEWEASSAHFRARIDALNKRITAHNLEAPSIHVQVSPINAQSEIERLTVT